MGMAEKRSPASERGTRKGAGGLITKTLDRCRSSVVASSRPKPAEGCFSVYVGAGRQRFVVRTEHVNHPLFRALLEEAEEAFGYSAAGPLELPCDADAFALVLDQIEDDKQRAAGGTAAARGCARLRQRSPSAYRLLGSTTGGGGGGRPVVAFMHVGYDDARLSYMP